MNWPCRRDPSASIDHERPSAKINGLSVSAGAWPTNSKIALEDADHANARDERRQNGLCAASHPLTRVS